MWIRLIIEFLGTFVLVTVAAGSGVINHYVGGGPISRTAAVIAPGAVVMAMIYAWGPLSGLHINPAVTFAFASRRVFPPGWVVPYWVVQFAGAICAALFLQLMFGDVSAGGNYPIAKPGGDWRSLVMETVLTAILVSVILNTATGARSHRPQRRHRRRVHGSPGTLDVPGRARGGMEAWQKWPFPFDPLCQEGSGPPGWRTVSKRRQICRFTLHDEEIVAGAGEPGAGGTHRVRTGDEAWWSLGLEATGPAHLLRTILEATAMLVFAKAVPGGAELSTGNSRSYAEWLHQLLGRGIGHSA